MAVLNDFRQDRRRLADKESAMTITSTKPTTELLISALTAGDARIQYSLRRALDRAARRDRRGRSEEFEALQGLLGGFGSTPEAGVLTALEPTLRHLLARVL